MENGETGPGPHSPFSVLHSPFPLVARGLVRRYGELAAVADFSLAVPAGAVYGLIGPNGAGKTTSLRMLATLLPPTAGEAWVGGASVTREPRQARRMLGYMPDFFGVYPELKVWEYLDFYAACHGVPAAERAGVAADLLELVDLASKRDAYVEGLSRGMQQRLGLARALVHDPAILLLDEPASGLDPRARRELREVVRELGRMGKAVLISSHILAELTDLCTHIAIMDRGRVLVDGPVEVVSRHLDGGRTVRVRTLGQAERLRDLLAAHPRVHAVRLEDDGTSEDPDGAASPGPSEEAPRSLRFVLDGDEQALRGLLAALLQAGLPIYSFAQESTGLEDAFLRVTNRATSDERKDQAR
jgi:ABC-2 type transport system ATP-binding protein